MRHKLALAALLAVAFMAAELSGPSWAVEYRIEPLGSLGGNYARARAVNNSGYVVGEALLPVQGTVERAFLWDGLAMSDLGTLGGLRSRAMDINGYGSAVGWAVDELGQTHPARWDANGYIEPLPTLGGPSGTAWAINDAGMAAGNAFVTPSSYRAVLWSATGDPQDLGTLGGSLSVAYDVNSSQVAVGCADDSSGKQRACVWRDGVPVSIGSVGGGVWNTARGINDSGNVILWGRPAGVAKNHAAIWSGQDGDPVIDLGTFGGEESWAYGLNNLGHVVGWAEDRTGFYRAFVYDGTEVIDLGTLGGHFSSAYGINDLGVIVGYAQNPLGQWEAVQWVPVPEPASCLALAGLLAALGGVHLRRRG